MIYPTLGLKLGGFINELKYKNFLKLQIRKNQKYRDKETKIIYTLTEIKNDNAILVCENRLQEIGVESFWKVFEVLK